MNEPQEKPPVVSLVELQAYAYCRRRAVFDSASLRARDEELASAILELQTLGSVGGTGPGDAAEMATLDRILSARRGSSWEGPEEILRETPFTTILGPCWKEVALCVLLPSLAAVALALALI